MPYRVGERGPELLTSTGNTTVDSTSIEQIDEALFHASLVPIDERGTFWRKWTDALTDQRNRLERQ